MTPTTRLLMWTGVIALGATLSAQGFNLQTGSWEITLRVDGTVPTAATAPPGTRPDVPLKKARTFTRCVTPDDVKTLNLGLTDSRTEKDCRVVKSTITPTVADMTRTCGGDDARTEVAHFEAPSPQTLQATITTTRGLETTKTTIAGKWLAAACQH